MEFAMTTLTKDTESGATRLFGSILLGCAANYWTANGIDWQGIEGSALVQSLGGLISQNMSTRPV